MARFWVPQTGAILVSRGLVKKYGGGGGWAGAGRGGVMRF